MTAKSPRRVVTAVCQSLEGSSPDRILAPQRGSPRTAYLRALSMLIWAEQHEDAPSYTAIGVAFGRDRRNAARGIARVLDSGLPSRVVLKNITDRLLG